MDLAKDLAKDLVKDLAEALIKDLAEDLIKDLVEAQRLSTWLSAVFGRRLNRVL